MQIFYQTQEWQNLVSDLQNDSAACTEIKKLAANAQAAPLASVTNKTQPLLPGATVHDYISIAPYWWPDPLQPEGRPWIRRDGEINPLFFEYDIGKLMQFCSETGVLILASMLMPNSEYAAQAGLRLRHWFLEPASCMNPHLNFAQFIPGQNLGRGIGIIDSIQLAYLFDLVQQLPFNSQWSTNDLKALRCWADEYLHWLLTSQFGQDECAASNNHGVYFDNLTAALANFAGRPELGRKHLCEYLPQRLEQIAADGSLPLELARTNSKSYSVFCLTGLLQEVCQARQFKMDFFRQINSHGSNLEQALAWLLPRVEPEFAWPWQQISEFHPHSLANLFYLAGKVSGDRAFSQRATACQRWPWERLLTWKPAAGDLILLFKHPPTSRCQ